VDLEDHAPLARPELLILIGNLDQGRLALRGPAREFAGVIALGDVAHQVKRLARLAEGPLRGIVVVRRDGQLAAARLIRLFQPPRQLSEKPVQRTDRIVRVETWRNSSYSGTDSSCGWRMSATTGVILAQADVPGTSNLTIGGRHQRTRANAGDRPGSTAPRPAATLRLNVLVSA
jgi:hypothetical protein